MLKKSISSEMISEEIKRHKPRLIVRAIFLMLVVQRFGWLASFDCIIVCQSNFIHLFKKFIF